MAKNKSRAQSDAPSEDAPRPVKFIGGDAFLIGVPAHDLTLDEWQELPADVRERALTLGLYVVEES